MGLHGQKLLVSAGQAQAGIDPMGKNPADTDPQVAQDEGGGNVCKCDAPRVGPAERVGSAGIASGPRNALSQCRHREREGYCRAPVESPIRDQECCQNRREEHCSNRERGEPRFSDARSVHGSLVFHRNSAKDGAPAQNESFFWRGPGHFWQRRASFVAEPAEDRLAFIDNRPTIRSEIPPKMARPRKMSRFFGGAPGTSGRGGRVSSLNPPKIDWPS